MKKTKNINRIVACGVFILIVLLMGKQTAKGESHVHTDACYEGVVHAGHTDGCYTTVEEPCGGTYQEYRMIYYPQEVNYLTYSYRYCANEACPLFVTKDAKTAQRMASSSDTGNMICSSVTLYSGGWYYYGKNGCLIKGGLTPSSCTEYAEGYGSWKCDACGKYLRNVTANVEVADKETWTTWQYMCSNPSCRQLLTCSAEMDYHPNTTCEGRTHSSRQVTKCTCNKEVGHYYTDNGNGTFTETPCVCHKVVKEMVPICDTYECFYGELFDIRANITFLDGTTRVVSCTYKEGNGDGEYNSEKVNELQRITVYPPPDLAWSESAKNKTPTSASVNVVMWSEFDVNTLHTDGGVVMLGDVSSKRCLLGTSVQVVVKAEAGYHLKSFSETGVHSVDKEKVLYSGVYSDTNYTKGTFTKGTGNVSSDGTVTYTFVMPRNDVSFYAEFEMNTYEITFNPCGGNWNGRTDPIISLQKPGVQYDKGTFFPENPVKEGNIFLGWFTEVDAGAKITGKSVHSSMKNAEFFARWRYVEGEKVVAHEYETPYRHFLPHSVEGFSFDSRNFWRFQKYRLNGYGEAANGLVTMGYDHTVYGRWDANVYLLTLNANGGAFGPEVVMGYTDADGKIAYISRNTIEKDVRYHMGYGILPEPERDGYSFVGWIDSETGMMYTPGGVVTLAKDMTLFAKWSTGTPSREAFSIKNLNLTAKSGANGETYDPSIAIPSTESLIITGSFAPWYVTWEKAEGAVFKVSRLMAFRAKSLSFSTVSEGGYNSLSNNKTPIDTMLHTYVYSDRTEYITSDEDIRIVLFNDPDTADTIMVSGVMCSAGSENFAIGDYTCYIETEVSQLTTSGNGKYSIDYSVVYEAIRVK